MPQRARRLSRLRDFPNSAPGRAQLQRICRCSRQLEFSDATVSFGESPSGKAPDFDSGIRRFDPYLPSHHRDGQGARRLRRDRARPGAAPLRPTMAFERMRVFTGNANPKLAEAVVRHMNISLGRCIVGRFSDGEVMVELLENVRGRDVFILQSTCAPTNDNLM